MGVSVPWIWFCCLNIPGWGADCDRRLQFLVHLTNMFVFIHCPLDDSYQKKLKDDKGGEVEGNKKRRRKKKHRKDPQAPKRPLSACVCLI